MRRRWTRTALFALLVACSSSTNTTAPSDGGADASDASQADAEDATGAGDGGRDVGGGGSDSGGADAGPACLPVVNAPNHRYVSTTGKDTDDGSPAHPWATITHAATVAKPGDTLHVLAGTYAENVVTASSGTAQARIRFVSDCRWGARIAPSGSTKPVWFNGSSPSGDYVDIVGFEVDGTKSAAAVGIQDEGSFSRTLGNHVHDIPAPTGCTDGNGGAGIDDADYSATDDDMIGNVVHDIGGASIGTCVHSVIQGLYHSNLRGHIQNNIVFHVAAFGIHMWHAANNVVVTNNTVFNNGWYDGSGYVGGGIIVGDGDSPGGVTNDDTTVSNNIVYKNGGVGIRDEGAVGPGNRYLSNLVLGNGVDVMVQTGVVSGTVAKDPLFVDYKPLGGGDYHLAAGSPAIDAGTTTCAANTASCAPADDYDGGGRPVGPAWDIGAYERGAAAKGWSWY